MVRRVRHQLSNASNSNDFEPAHYSKLLLTGVVVKSVLSVRTKVRPLLAILEFLSKLNHLCKHFARIAASFRLRLHKHAYVLIVLLNSTSFEAIPTLQLHYSTLFVESLPKMDFYSKSKLVYRHMAIDHLQTTLLGRTFYAP